MKLYHWLLLILSALLYAGAFLYNDYCWWFTFIFSIPFLYVATYDNFSFKHGFGWSLVTFLLHMIGGICVVSHMACMPLCGFYVAVGMIFIQSLFVGGLFFCAQCFNFSSSIFYKLCRAAVVLFLFILYVDRYCLSMFGVIEGYPLMHPLIPLIHCPSLLWLLPIIGKNCLTLLLLLPAVTIISFLQNKNVRAFLFCLCACAPWLISPFMGKNYALPGWVHCIKPVPYMMINDCADQTAFKFFLHDLIVTSNMYNNHSLFILPESSINLMTDIAQCACVLTSKTCDKHFIFGASYLHDNHCYNAAIWLHNGAIQHCFHKKHAMLLSERIPTLKNNFLKNLFFNDKRFQIMTGRSQRQIITIEGVTPFVPYICSELFFNEYPDDNYHDTPILVLVNDSVFLQHACSRYICNELQMLARFKAVQWQREIVYVSYSQSFYCGKDGYGTLLSPF